MAGVGGGGELEIPDIPYGGSGTGGGGTSGGGTTGGGGNSGGGDSNGLGIDNDTIVQNEVGGDLGQGLITSTRQEFLTKALRMNATQNVPRLHVHRYRGHREAYKFNYYVQSIMQVAAYNYFVLRDRDATLQATEVSMGPASSSTATSSEIALIYHIHKQITFREWMLSRDTDVRWFLG